MGWGQVLIASILESSTCTPLEEHNESQESKLVNTKHALFHVGIKTFLAKGLQNSPNMIKMLYMPPARTVFMPT